MSAEDGAPGGPSQSALVPRGVRPIQKNGFSQLSGLLEWAEDEVAQNPAAASIALACVGAEEGDTVVVQKILPSKQDIDARSALIAAHVEAFYATAQGETEESPRSQTYMLVAYGKGKNDFLGRRKFTLHPPINRQLNAELEPPTEKGFHSLVTRWGDNSLRLSSANQQAVIDLLQSELERKERDLQSMRVYNKQLEDRRLDEFKITEELRSKALERELALKREARQDERLERLWRQVEGYVPLLVSKYTGTPLATLSSGAPAAPNASPIDRFATFFFGLTGDQKQQMLSVLSEPQQQEFMDILQALVAAKQEAEKAKEKAPAPPPAGA